MINIRIILAAEDTAGYLMSNLFYYTANKDGASLCLNIIIGKGDYSGS